MIFEANTRWILAFVLITGIGTVWVGSMQVFVYDDFMRFSANEKALAHSGTMVGWALGSVLSVWFTRCFEKKTAVVFGGLISIFSNIVLALLFLTGFMPLDAVWKVGNTTIPLALCSFVMFHAGYWLGIGFGMPVATAMMADLSEVNFLRTGIKKEGGYSSIFSLVSRLATAIGLITSGFCLNFIGYNGGQAKSISLHNPEAIWRLGGVTFMAGAFMCLMAILAIRAYPLTSRDLETMRGAHDLQTNI